MPLHTTQNHNGQLTDQVGIHASWESRLPELSSQEYNYLVGQAKYIENPHTEIWKIITHSLVDSVMTLEADLNRTFPTYRKYSFSKRNNQVLKRYSTEYAKAYHASMNNMVERQMKSAIITTGSFWHSAWVDAGQQK